MDGTLLLDPTLGEARREDGSLLLALMPARNMVRCRAACQELQLPPQLTLGLQVTEMSLRGQWAKQDLTDVVQLAMGGCLQVDRALRDCLTAAPAD